jgi:AcrR family transcriptional regulator
MSETAVRKGVKTRQIFMDAGRRVFARDGYLNAEISEIAREAGKSNGTFYIYFENKSALLDALIKDFDDYIDERLAEASELWYGASQAGNWQQIVYNMWESFKLHAATLRWRRRRWWMSISPRRFAPSAPAPARISRCFSRASDSAAIARG